MTEDQTVRFEGNSGRLVLDNPQNMQASIAGFRPGDQIQLGQNDIDAADYTPTATGGSLALYQGGNLLARLDIEGAHQLGDFVISVAADSGSDGGAITTLSVLAPTSLTATSAAAPGAEVYASSIQPTARSS